MSYYYVKVILVATLVGLWTLAEAEPVTEVCEDDTTTKNPLDGKTSEETEATAAKLMEEIEKEMTLLAQKYQLADFESAINVNNETLAKKMQLEFEYGAGSKRAWEKVRGIPWQTFKNAYLKRQFASYSIIGDPALPADKYQRIKTEMESTFAKAKVCDFKNPSKCDLSLEPDIVNAMSTSRDYNELLHLWKAWRDATGKKYKDLYAEYVSLINDAAKINGFKHGQELWLTNFESETFVDDINKLWDQMRPFYNEIHAYVRRHLRKQYGEDKISKDGAIPAHILGNMWAQEWTYVAEFSRPYPDVQALDITAVMKAKNYTVLDMFKMSEEFFTSIGFPPMLPKFWKNSVIEKIPGREMVCHASAFDLSTGDDFRIKQCTQVTFEDLVTVHHEMGHIIYFMMYKDHPLSLREAANAGFHEAIGDLISLSVSTPKHLHKVCVLDELNYSKEMEINYLYKQALHRVVFLPFALNVDQFRWDLFAGKVKPDGYNCHWWNLRFKNQGVRPGETRKLTDFDPGSKYHVPSGIKYIIYFVAHIIQFQLHKSLCIVAGEYDPSNPEKALHNCDIYGNTKAGNLLADMLRLGYSKHWSEALEMVTGQKTMDASAILEYYKPLYDWLKADNAKHNEYVGWKEQGDLMCG